MGALTNFSATFDNLHAVSARSRRMDNMDALVETNRPAIGIAASNLVFFSEQLNQFAGALSGLVATNSPESNLAVKNIESSSATLKHLLEGVQERERLGWEIA